jgi:hypothetical protein
MAFSWLVLFWRQQHQAFAFPLLSCQSILPVNRHQSYDTFWLISGMPVGFYSSQCPGNAVLERQLA